MIMAAFEIQMHILFRGGGKRRVHVDCNTPTACGLDTDNGVGAGCEFEAIVH